MPVGPTAKVRSNAAAEALTGRLGSTAAALGLRLAVHRSDGRQPVGFGIGPALEARDVLKVLRGEADAPADLRERALDLAGELLDLVPGSVLGQGRELARDALASGRALAKFYAICEAQGGFTEPTLAGHHAQILALHAGRVASIDNRHLAKVAKLAGAPAAATAGLTTAIRIGDAVRRGDLLYTVHAQTRGELKYALAYARAHPQIVSTAREAP